MPKKIEEKLHILSPSRGYIAPAKIMGPIVHPISVTKSIAAQILMSGAEVYEFIPETKETFKLTLGNINNPNRYAEYKKGNVAAPVEPIKAKGVPAVTTPVVDAPVDGESVVKEPAVEETLEGVVETTEETTAPVEESTTVEDGVEGVADESSENTDDFISTLAFEYKEDGTIDETNINWSSYSKNERKAIRARINQHNATITQE